MGKVFNLDKETLIKKFLLHRFFIVAIEAIIVLIFVFVLPQLIKFNQERFIICVVLELLSMFMLMMSITVTICMPFLWKNIIISGNEIILNYTTYGYGKNVYVTDNVSKIQFENITNIKYSRGFIIIYGKISRGLYISNDTGFSHDYGKKYEKRIEIPRIYKDEEELIKLIK